MEYLKIKKQLSALLAVIIAFSAVSVFGITAEAAVSGSESVGVTYTSEGYKYQIYNNDTIAIVGCTLTTPEIYIPTTINGHTVVTIERLAFYKMDNLKSITLPDTITKIGDNAFLNCKSLVSINIPSGVTEIGTAAFYGCESLKSFTVPAKVKNIGLTSFERCLSLENIYVDSANQYYTDINGVLYSKDLKTLYQYPAGKVGSSYVIPNTVTAVTEGAFANNTLKSVTIPDSVTTIGKDAFGWSTLEEIVIPDSVTEIGNWAFCGCTQLKSAKLSKNTLVLPNLLFYNTALESLKIPEGVTTINKKAFSNTNLKSAIVPKSVVKINSMALGYYEEEPIKDYAIKGYKQSAAETYANENGFKFIDVEQLGDADLSGFVDIADVTLIQKYIAHLEPLDEIQLNVADVNGDKYVDINDITLIQKMLAHLI